MANRGEQAFYLFRGGRFEPFPERPQGTFEQSSFPDPIRWNQLQVERSFFQPGYWPSVNFFR
jgi:hypothetical protein